MSIDTRADSEGTEPAVGRLAGKTAVITGGAAGIGRATALTFAAQGAAVAILDIQKEAGEEVEQQIRNAG